MSRVIAIDLGATNIRVARVSGDGLILKVAVSLTPGNPAGPEELTDEIVRLVRSVSNGDDVRSMDGIGIGAAGPVDQVRGTVINPPNISLPCIDLVGPLRDEFGIPVHLINDCPAGLLGEVYFGDGRGCSNLVYITMSTGIGAGIVCNGTVVLGRQGNAGEIGHLHVDTRYGMVCGCGTAGHWEGYSSGRHLPAFFNRWCEVHGVPGEGDWSRAPEGIFAAARNNYPGTRLFIEELNQINARGLSDVIVAYDPSRIILDGSVISNNTDLMLESMIQQVDRYLPLPLISISRLGGFAPLLGASIIARGYSTTIGSLWTGDQESPAQ